jgi:PAS domain S-box-containing protein
MTSAYVSSGRVGKDPPEQSPTPCPVEMVSAREGRECVLVVDDDSLARELITKLASATGRRVKTASSVAEAREWLTSEDFALAICDLRGPAEPGISLVRWIRKERPGVAVLIAAGADDSALADAALAAGAYGYLTKPFKRDEVVINLVDALRRRRLEIETRNFCEYLERRFRDLVARLPVIVYLWEAGADGNCYYVSPAIESVLGFAPKEWVRDQGLWVRRLHPEDRDRVIGAELRCRESGQDLACEYRMLARDGRVVWIRDEAVMIRNDGAAPYLQGLMYDVSTEKEAQASLRRSREETVRRLSHAAELRDDDTGAHIERVSRYCELIAERLGLDPEFREQLRIASPMHDVGKIGIADAILLKPGPLDAAERAEMERHAEIGHRILAGSGAELLDLAAMIAWTHHERFDGNGYPRGLKGEEIPLEGRIAAVADVFDALTSDRVYRPALPHAEAVALMRSERGSHFDPRVLDAFLKADCEVRAIMSRIVPPAAAAGG